MNEILAIVVTVLASLQCAAEERISPEAKSRVEVQAQDVLSKMPPGLVVAGMSVLSRKQPVPDEVCESVEQTFGGDDL